MNVYVYVYMFVCRIIDVILHRAQAAAIQTTRRHRRLTLTVASQRIVATIICVII